MRIDFSKLEQLEQTSRPAAPLLNSLPVFWQKQQPQKQDFQLPSIEEEDQNSLSFSVTFPYEVNRRLSPSAINKQLSYLQANRVLPLSTLKFIQNTLQSDREKSLSPENKDLSRVSHRQQQLSHSKLDTLAHKPEEQPSEKVIQFSKKNSVQISPQKQKIIEIHRCVQMKKKPSNKKRVQSKVYSIPIKQPPPKKQQSMQEVTLRPLLNYSMNSRAAKDMTKKRKQHFTACNSNVFLSLYNDAARYAKKRQIERVMIEEAVKVQKKKSRRTLSTTFEERYHRSLEKQASRNQKAQHKVDYDEQTGRRYFVPDTTVSKMTYLTLFKSTTSVEMFPDDEPRPVRSNYYSRESSKLNHSPEQLTTTLNRSCELTSSYDNRYSVKSKIPERQSRLAELYADVLWSEESIREEELTKEERHALAKFLESVEQFQYGRSVSRQVFTALFKRYYITLNLFDKAVIDARLKHSRKIKKQAEESIASNHYSLLAGPTRPKKQNRFSNLSHASKLYFV